MSATANTAPNYHERFKEYWSWIQREDLVVDGAMTDPKGDRGKRPAEQNDPDLYLRVKERRPEGIVISGAKLHQTGVLNSHEILVMPTLTMRPGEEAWAVCCAVPTDTRGVHYIYGRQTSDTRKLEKSKLDVGNPVYGGQEVMTVFEDVFVPNERVFMNGEVDFSGVLVERFASYHRQSYGGCKAGVGDVLIGATALIARMNGVAKAEPHQRQAGGDDSPERNDLLLRDRLLGHRRDARRRGTSRSTCCSPTSAS